MPSPASVLELRERVQSALGPAARVAIRRDPGGSLLVGVVAPADDDDVETAVRSALRTAEVDLPEGALLIAVEPDAAPRWLEEGYRPLPSWAECLSLEPGMQAPSPRGQIAPDVIAFWGVKGGVGRSTALVHCAARIARMGRRVLVADFDLDAPTLVGTWCPDIAVPVRFDRLLASAGVLGEDDVTFRQDVQSALRVGPPLPDGVAVIGPDLADEEHVRSLLGRLPPAALFRGRNAAPWLLLRVAAELHRADVVLIDTRAGYCDESAMVLLDLADTIVMFGSSSPSTYRSMAVAMQAVERAHIAWGQPRAAHYVLGMMPAGADARRIAREELLAVADEARTTTLRSLGLTADALLPDVDPVEVDYFPSIVENDGHLVDALPGYVTLAERLSPPKPAPVPAAGGTKWMKDLYREWNARSVVAEDAEIDVLAKIFTRTSEMERLGRREIPMILGAKGSGKTMLRRLCLERPDLVKPFFRTPGREPVFIDAFSQKLTSSKLEFRADLLRGIAKDVPPSGTWSAIALLRTLERLAPSEDVPLALPAVAALLTPDELVGAAFDPQARLKLVERLGRQELATDTAWEAIAALIASRGKELVLVFDDLDTLLGLGEDAVEPRARLIAGLLDRLDRSWTDRPGLQAKVFLRADLLRRSGIEEGAKFQGSRALKLEWNALEIWRFLVRFVLAAAPSFAVGLASVGITFEEGRDVSEEDARRALSVFWGERTGPSESSARSLVWVQKRLTDGKGRMFPRAAGWLVDAAVQSQRAKGENSAPPVVSPPALREAIREAASSRLAELENESSVSENRYLRCLHGFISYQDRVVFEHHLREAGVADDEVGRAIQLLQELGVIEFGQRQDKRPTVRIVDLYAFAKDLEVDRLGRQ